MSVLVNIDVPDLAAGIGPICDKVFGQIAPMRDPFGHGVCLIEFNDQGYGAAS